MSQEDYLRSVKSIHGKKYKYNKIIYKGNRKIITVTCRIHGDFEISARGFSDGAGCKECYKISRRKTQKQFIIDARAVHGNRFSYKNTKYIDKRHMVTVTCRTHGDFELLTGNHLQGGGCARCRISKGELTVKKYLDLHGIEYEQQYKIEGYRYQYDFYIPQINGIIEFDGEQHFMDMRFGWTHEEFGRRKEIDIIKSVNAVENRYRLLRISYNELDNVNYILKYWLKKPGRMTFDNVEDYKSYITALAKVLPTYHDRLMSILN